MASDLKVVGLLAILWQWIILQNSSTVVAQYRSANIEKTCEIQKYCLEKDHQDCKERQKEILDGNAILLLKLVKILQLIKVRITFWCLQFSKKLTKFFDEFLP